MYIYLSGVHKFRNQAGPSGHILYNAS